MAVIATGTLVVLVVTLLVILLVKKLLQICTGPKLPPGPMPLPFIGNLHLLASRPEQSQVTLHELAIRYGDAFTLNIFTTKFIVFNSYEIIKEVFSKNAHAFSKRSRTYILNLAYDNGKGLFWQKGDWRDIRKKTTTALRDFGVGKKSMEWKIMEEANALSDAVAEYGGKPFNPSQLVAEAASNVICNVCFGSRFDYKDEQFRCLVNKIQEALVAASLVFPVDYIPILQYFPLPSDAKMFLENNRYIDNFIMSQIEEHRVTFDKNNLRDFIDLYLNKEAEDKRGNGRLDDNFRWVINDMFFAGTDTTATTTRWAIVYMLHYPEIQARLAEEMEQAVGNERQLTLADRTQLNYLQAFINETLRHASVVFSALPHLCSEDTKIGDYTIPNGATVIMNLYHVHMSERYWKNPTQFNPDRFLDANGKIMTIKEGFLPFGAGPRQCVGESLARNELLVILGTLIQKFTFKPEDESNLPPLLGKAGVIIAPEQFKVRAIPK